MAAVQAPLYVQYDRQEVMYEDEDVAELSDSPSSKTSWSRPTTPSHDSATSIAIPQQSQGKEGPLALAAKAERILGLVPGTLVHARAALENARDEVRRTADSSAPFSTYVPAGVHTTNASSSSDGLKKVVNRARKAMSVSLNSMPNVVIGIGGKEEMLVRERRRRAVDGVLYWQKEVARLEALERPQTGRTSKR